MAYALTIYTTLPFLLCCTGANGLVISSVVGGDAVLPCEAGPNTDATDLPLYWYRPDLPPNDYVHFRRDGKDEMTHQSPNYKGRTSLCKDGLKKGNVSLTLTRVNSSDEGIYTCYIPELFKEEITVRLIVEMPQAPDNGSLKDGHGDTSDTKVPTTGLKFPGWGGLLIALGIIIIIIIIIIIMRRRLLKFVNGFCPKSSGNDRYPNLENGGAGAKNGVSAEVKLKNMESGTDASTPLTSQEAV